MTQSYRERRATPAAGTHTMRVEPAGHLVEVNSGESLIEAAWREGFEWPTLCYGLGKCTACQCEVVEGLDHVSPHTDAEVAMLRDFTRRVRRADPLRVRLACQVQISGDVVVRKPGVKPKAGAGRPAGENQLTRERNPQQ